MNSRRRDAGARRAAASDSQAGGRGSPPAVPPALGAPAPSAPPQWRTLTLGEQTLAIPGDPACDDDGRDPANRLLVEYAPVGPGDRVLLLGAGCGLLAAWLARRIAPGHLTISDVHSTALDRAAGTLRRNGCAGFDVLPADRLGELSECTLAAALVNSAFQSSAGALGEMLEAVGRALRVGGRLYVAGARAKGIGAIKARMAEIFGASATLGYRKGVHVVVATRPEGWAATLVARPVETIVVTVREHTFQLALREGVFARGGLDDGTRMLLEALDVWPTDAALDLGCGGGIVGMLLARLAPESHVDLVDSDALAVGLARHNLAINGIANATVHCGDGISALPGATFDLIATNPPFHLGLRQTTGVARQFIADSARALRPAGRFYLVANRFLPYERDIASAFGNVREVAGDGRYKVLAGIRDVPEA